MIIEPSKNGTPNHVDQHPAIPFMKFSTGLLGLATALKPDEDLAPKGGKTWRGELCEPAKRPRIGDR
jgi:hypothetical protein